MSAIPLLVSYAPRYAEQNEVLVQFRADCFDESQMVSEDVLENRVVEVILDQDDVKALIRKVAPANIPRCIQEKIHFRLYHDLKKKGVLPANFPVPCDPYHAVEDAVPSHLDGDVEGEFVRVRVIRQNGRAEEARYNLLRGGFSDERYALGWEVKRWAPLKKADASEGNL